MSDLRELKLELYDDIRIAIKEYLVLAAWLDTKNQLIYTLAKALLQSVGVCGDFRVRFINESSLELEVDLDVDDPFAPPPDYDIYTIDLRNSKIEKL